MRKHVKKTVAIISLLFAAILLLGGCGAAPATASSSEVSSVISSSSSSEVKAEPEALPTVESLEINASVLSNPDNLGEAWEGGTTGWLNAGATPENAKAALASGDIPGYTTKIAAEYDTLYTAALLDPKWQSDPAIVAWVSRMVETHRVTLECYFKTSFPNLHPEDKEAYKRTSTYIKTDSYTPTDGSYTLVSDARDTDNADKNHANELLGGDTLNVTGYGIEATEIFRNENGQVKLSGFISATSKNVQ